MKLLHLTDLHIGPDGLGPALEGAAGRAERAIQRINARHADAELCVLTGDIVYDPDPAAYAMAEAILARCAVPIVGLIGNHDDRAMALETLSCIQADAHGFCQRAIETAIGLIVTLDTKAAGTHGGELCPTRLAWLEATLAAHPGPVYLFMHHAPFATGLRAMDQIGLRAADARALDALVRRHGQVKHLFFGHYHRPMSGRWGDVAFSAHRSMMAQCALDLETEDHVPAIFEEPQLAVVLASADLTVVHYDDFLSSAPLLSLGGADGP